MVRVSPRARHRIRIILISLGLAVAASLVTGYAYESISRARDARRFPRIGNPFGPRRLNLFCSGTGSPTVIFEAGLGEVGYSFGLVQPEVAKFTRACWYDRAGYGWSEPAPGVRDARTLAVELHDLLQAAGVSPPYVIVGHSFGGYVVRVYNGLYPNEVAGVVFADASHEDQFAYLPAAERGAMRPGFAMKMVPYAIRFGVLRLMAQAQGSPFAGLPEQLRPTLDFLMTKPSFYDTVFAEIRSFEKASSDQVRSSGTLADKPVIVLTAGKPDPAKDEFRTAWVQKLQPALAALSTRGKQVMVPESGHMIPYDAPGRLAEAVREVIAQLR